MNVLNDLPSLAEVSREVGVSTATVSRVLNGKPGISESTRVKVRAALERHGYPGKPVKGGFQSLRHGNNTIAFVTDSTLTQCIQDGDPFYGRHALAIQAACYEFGCYPILVNQEWDRTPDGGLRCVEEGQVHGIIGESLPDELLLRLRDQLAVVILNGTSTISGVDYVIPDMKQAVREQIECLTSLGHRHIACFRFYPGAWEDQRFWAEMRMLGATLNLPQPEEYFQPLSFGRGDHEIAISQFLDRILASSAPPTAILTHDFYASFLVLECQKRGLEVPHDMSLIGFDDTASQWPVSISTYRQNFEGMAREAVRLLLDRSTKPDLPSRTVSVEGKSIQRDSVGPAPRTR